MSFNTFGKIFRFTTWGESHGPAIGCIIDGCPPNIPLSEEDIQKGLYFSLYTRMHYREERTRKEDTEDLFFS